MGFEGQLGLGCNYKVLSSPKYNKYFYRNPVTYITCGTNYSFCITEKDNYLYGWGENKLGQLGIGKGNQIVDSPNIVTVDENQYLEYKKKLDKRSESNNNNNMIHNSISNNNNNHHHHYKNKDNLSLEEKEDLSDYYSYNRHDNNNTNNIKCTIKSENNCNNNNNNNKIPLKAKLVAAGYAHTAVISIEGPLYLFGLNIYGQLGLGNTKTEFEPQIVVKDENENYLKPIKKVACNVTGTFIIVESGELYTCGSKNIGHGDIEIVLLPRKVNENRSFEDIFCNIDSVVCFCPLKIYSVSPNLGPSTGNTILSIIGSAFKDFPSLKVRFSIYSKQIGRAHV